jgi:histidine decarboxylase
LTLHETSDAPFGPNDEPWCAGFGRILAFDSAPLVSPPSSDPRELYPDVPEIPYGMVQLPPQGLTEQQYQKAEAAFRSYVDYHGTNSVGYQLSGGREDRHRLGYYLNHQLNNLGDPYRPGLYTTNSKILERAVLDYFASLWNAKWPHRDDDPESYWGYVLSMGTTEGNLYGLWNARECLSGAPLLKQYEGTGDGDPSQMTAGPDQREESFHPVAFFTEDAHYSINKAVRVLGIDTFHTVGTLRYPNENPLGRGTPWPRTVPSIGGPGGTGEIDLDKLAVLVRFFARRGYPILLNMNYGSTFKGAFDDVAAASRLVHDICDEYGLAERTVHHGAPGRAADDARPGYWVHVDGALGAGYAPFLQMAKEVGLVDSAPPIFDFRLPYVHSITTSGHKWMGAPWPCGIFMTRTGLQMLPPARSQSEYIGSPDTTFAGSRNGFSALLMWDYVARHSYDDEIRTAAESDSLAGYVYDRLCALQSQTGRALWVARSPHSLAIRFRRPNPRIVRKYSLAYETAHIDGETRHYVHVFPMKHVTRDVIDHLISDLRRADAFDDVDAAPDTGPDTEPGSASTLVATSA